MTDSDDETEAWRVADDEQDDEATESAEVDVENGTADSADDSETTPLEAVAKADAASTSTNGGGATENKETTDESDTESELTPAEATTVGETETGSVERILDEEAGVVVYTYESDQRSNITTIPLADTLLEDE